MIGGRQIGGILNQPHLAVDAFDLVLDRGGREDKFEAVLAFQSFLDDLHVQQAEESHAIAKAERGRGFRLVLDRTVGQSELVECVGELLVVGRVGRVETGEDHRLGFPVTGQGIGLVASAGGHRVADADVGDIFEAGGDVADVARGQRVEAPQVGRETADLHRFEAAIGGGQAERRLPPGVAVDDAHVGDDALVGVVFRVEDQRAKRFVRFAGGRGNSIDDGFQ